LKPYYPAAALDRVWRECRLTPQARAEELELEMLVKITNAIGK